MLILHRPVNQLYLDSLCWWNDHCRWYGGLANNTVTITWNTAGATNVSVNYTNGNGCTAAFTNGIYNVTVNPLPTPTISGPATVCVDIQQVMSIPHRQA